MMRLPSFRYRTATSAADAAAALAGEGPGARAVAGGTDLYPNLKRRHQQARTVVSLRRARDLFGISGSPATGMRIGAMTTLDAICRNADLRRHYPGFVRAVASISSPPLRHMGTIGGNLCLDTRCTYYNQNEEWRAAISYCKKEAGEICWVAPSSPRCWAISAADSVPVLCALEARVRLVGSSGSREIGVAELYQDDGIHYLTTNPAEILAELILPPAGAARATYWKLRRRGSIDFPVLGVGAALAFDANGAVARAGLYLGAVSSAPIRCRPAEQALVGQPLTEATIAAAAKLARAEARPLDNTDFVMSWRAKMSEVYVDGALRELAGLPVRTLAPAHGAWAALA